MALVFFCVLPFLVGSAPGGLREYVDTVHNGTRTLPNISESSGGDVVSSGGDVVSGNMVEDSAESIETGVDGDSVSDTSGVATIEGDVSGSVSGGDVANVDASAGALAATGTGASSATGLFGSSLFGGSSASSGNMGASSFAGQEVPIATIGSRGRRSVVIPVT